jgi:hypothetical protein
MADLLQTKDGMLRIANAVMRTNGGRAVLLRLPGMAATNDDAEQLGLGTPEFQDVVLGPATFHKANSATKLLVSASAVDALLVTLGYDSADVLFETAVGVLIDGLLYEITNSYASQAMGVAYCYWLVLQPPVR